VRDEVGNAVSAGIEMELVGNAVLGERIVEFACAAIEAEGILGAAIEIDFRFLEGERIFPGQQEGAVQVLEFAVDGIAEHVG